MPGPISTIVFDLGGVLIELGDFPVKAEWMDQSKAPNTQNLTQWLKSDLGQAFEKGEISARQFGIEFVATNHLKVDPEVFLEHFRQWPKRAYPGAHEYLDSLKEEYTLAIYSNNNEIHWDRLINGMGLAGRFDYYFASHLLGISKPDVSSFEILAKKMSVEAHNILFLDDSQANVDAARAAGWNSVLVKGLEEAITAVDSFCKIGKS